MALSENLQYIRAQHSITQEQLAEQLDVTRQSVSKWESAQSYPEMDTILKICDLYNVNLDTLLRGSIQQDQVSDTAQYNHFMNVFSLRISLSVFGIILGIALAAVCEARGLSDAVCGAVLLMAVTIAVVVLVSSGLQYDQFCKRYPVIADFYTQEQKDAFQRKFIWLITGGVGLILFDLLLLLLFLDVYGGVDTWEDYIMAGFLFLVACAVLAFVYAGLQKEKYDIARYNRKNNPTPEAKARHRAIGKVCAALMTLASAFYVGAGLALDQWRTALWILAVGGISCGVAAIVLDPDRGGD